MTTDLPCISTGSLPALERARAAVGSAYDQFRGVNDGEVADYIPALAKADPAWFGIGLLGAAGIDVEAGDSRREFTIQSVSKPFVFALVCQELGEEAARAKLGVNSTGLPFNSAVAIERARDGATNPMVNSGAIAAASLAPGETAEAKWRFLREGLSRFAGRELTLDDEVYRSEMATNARNEGIARLLQVHGRIYSDPAEAVDVYTRQCSLRVTAHDLAVMAATLANGGVNPLTREKILDEVHCPHVLAVMVTAGLYENSGDWLYDTGLPGKSGVSGGMVAVAPGKAGLAVFSPPLDDSGNSVRGVLVARDLAASLGLNLFSSRAADGGSGG